MAGSARHHLHTFREIAPKPTTIAETGLDSDFLFELLAKYLLFGGVLNQQQLIERSGLAWQVLDSLINLMRTSAYIEVRSPSDGSQLLRYALSERGRAFAQDALSKSGYKGPAPVPLELYTKVVAAQDTALCVVTSEDVARVFKGVVVRNNVLAQLGPAMHSGRPILVYGPPGTGKTYIGLRLVDLLTDSVLIPYALAVGHYVVEFFDSAVHVPIENPEHKADLLLDHSFDLRFIHCKRPAVITGGELRLDMLELAYDPTTKQYFAPLHLKANNGIYMIDDLGRQRFRSSDLLNRWIVPLEKKIDFLSVGSTTRFEVPFDVKLIFSTNMDPTDLADEAFLRRLGYKVRFEPPSHLEFEAIWRQVCDLNKLPFDEHVFQHALSLYRKDDRMLLHCQPRDLIALVFDQCRFEGSAKEITVERLDWAWDNYFVR